MGKQFQLLTVSVGMTLILGLSITHAFNSATHLYIAQEVFQVQDIDLYYGSIAPDLALYADPEKWPTSFEDTHYNYIDLSSYASGFTKKAFASGWLTHNEVWGADYYAHIVNPIGNNICITQGNYQGYVIEKACLLSSQTGIDPEFAHYVVETAIDLLLRNNDDPKLGKKLLNAILFRSWIDCYLLAKGLFWEEKRTDWQTLANAELTFRNLVSQYAITLALPSPYNEKAFAKLGAQLALELYGIDISQEEVLNILETAITLCEGDYKEVINFAIEEIQNQLW
jgi:hypothetical protein